MKNETFVWTEELVMEFALEVKITGTKNWVSNQMADFKIKKSKQLESDNKYVIKNKPCLSINEIMPIVEKGGFIEYRLTLLVKEKIENNG